VAAWEKRGPALQTNGRATSPRPNIAPERRTAPKAGPQFGNREWALVPRETPRAIVTRMKGTLALPPGPKFSQLSNQPWARKAARKALLLPLPQNNAEGLVLCFNPDCPAPKISSSPDFFPTAQNMAALGPPLFSRPPCQPDFQEDSMGGLSGPRKKRFGSQWEPPPEPEPNRPWGKRHPGFGLSSIGGVE